MAEPNKIGIHELGELFERVQMSAVFGDGKTFPDCIPRRDLESINADYLFQKDRAGFDLKIFLDQNFESPKAYSTGFRSNSGKPLKDHIAELWDVLTRQPEKENSSLIPLPFPYVVPGGRFREIYYWDSYFTMLGLAVSGRQDLIQNMIANFAYLIDRIGYIPNGNRSYFIGRSQPPFFSLMVRLLDHTSESLTKYLPQLEAEYRFWMAGENELSNATTAVRRVVRLDDAAILNRYWDENDSPRPEAFREDVELSHQAETQPETLFRHLRAAAESGWDFSSRWFRDAGSFASIHTTDIIPVDLNCLVVHLEQTLAEAYDRAGRKSDSARLARRSEDRKSAIEKYCWREEEGFYFDYDFVGRQPMKHRTLAAVFPLFFKVAAKDHAARVYDQLRLKFLKPGGMTTTLENTGQQWDAPNGWAPLQWIAFKGLKNYGYHPLAEELRSRWTGANEKVYARTGKMTEKYDVWNADGEASGGEYPNQDGFGWTNGVYLAMKSD